MANTNVNAQSAPAATTRTDLYTVPSATNTVLSSVIICNTSSSTSDTFELTLAPLGATHGISQYLYKGVTVPASQTFIATIGIAMTATDKIRVYSTGGNLTFTVCGVQVA